MDTTATVDLWLFHYSCASWSEPARWERYFNYAQEILGANITHLDENDPVRRRVKTSDLREATEYLTWFGKRENSRTVFGRLDDDIEFTISLYRPEKRRDNSCKWYFPPQFLEKAQQLEAVLRLFNLGNDALNSFYAYSDRKGYPMSKKRETGAINFFRELLGVFWLTYFDYHYVDFFGRENLAALERMGVGISFDQGATLRLGEIPESVPHGFREAVEEFIGPKTFVDPKDHLTVKRPGQYALSYEQLRM